MNKLLITHTIACFMSVLVGCATTENHPEGKTYTRAEKARMLVEVANGSLAERDATGALQSLARAALHDDALPELYHSKALAFYLKNDRQAALNAAKKAVDLKPDYADANSTLGKIYMDLGQFKDAEKYLKVAAQDPLYREAFKAQTNLGIIAYQTSRFKEAEHYFDLAIHEAPSSACVAYYYKGNVELKSHRMADAVKNFLNATKKTCANYGAAHFALGLAYQQAAQYPQARKTFIEVQKRYPNTQLAQQALDQLQYLP